MIFRFIVFWRLREFLHFIILSAEFQFTVSLLLEFAFLLHDVQVDAVMRFIILHVHIWYIFYSIYIFCCIGIDLTHELG